MAVGGMVGGGIFSVLGLTVDFAGHLAFASFLVGGALALITARSYARLTVVTGEGGGPFAYLRHADDPRAAAWLSWLLIAGYVFTLAVYAFTFGHYLANVVGLPDAAARIAGICVIALFLGFNLRGVVAAGRAEDLIVAAKVFILLAISLAGLVAFSSSVLTPLANKGPGGVLWGSAVIFMAYEGFELLPYDYEDIEKPNRTLPLALYLSVAAVIALYVLVTLGSQLLVPEQTLIKNKEVAFAVAGREAFGTAGLWLASIGALFSAGSAINATLFSAARLARNVSKAGELPRALGREHSGLPWMSTLVIAVAAAGFSLMPGIEQIVSFGSLTFLIVFAVVNGLHAKRTAAAGGERALAWTGAAGCVAAAGGLIVYLATHQRATLGVAGTVLTVLAIARGIFVALRRRGADG
jgi:amino acid transporter